MKDLIKEAREYKYGQKRGNYSIDLWKRIKQRINPHLPLRPTNKWSPKEIRECGEDIEIFIRHYSLMQHYSKDNTLVHQYSTLFHSWTIENHKETVKQMKLIEKRLRTSKSSYVIQSICTFHRSYDFYPEKDIFNDTKLEYINQYLAIYKDPVDNTGYRFSKLVIILLSSQLEDWMHRAQSDEKYSKRFARLPSVSMSKSPLGDKYMDFRRTTDILRQIPICDEIADHYHQINILLEELNLPLLEFQRAGKPFKDLTQQQRQLTSKLIPNFNMIPNPGKLRPIFISNDILDVVLDKFRLLVRIIFKELSSSYNSKRIKDDYYLNVDIPENIRKVYKNSLECDYSGRLVNSDLSSATDKIHISPQKNLLMDIINDIDDKQLLSTLVGVNDIQHYVSTCIDLIGNTVIFYEFENSNKKFQGIGIPRFGQCQGLRGSFDMLNLIHTAIMLQSILDSDRLTFVNKFTTSIRRRLKNLPFLVNGDDGVLPVEIQESYQKIWSEISDSGIISEEKSSQEGDSYIEFCKQLVLIDKNERQPLNALRFDSFCKLVSNDTLLRLYSERFDTSDFWKSLRMLSSELKKTNLVPELVQDTFLELPDYNRSEFLKIKSAILEIYSLYAIKISSNKESCFTVRSAIDETDTPFNVFDRERLFPDSETSESTDWLEKIGLIPIINKFKISTNVEYIDVNQEALKMTLDSSYNPYHIIMIGKKVNPELAKDLVHRTIKCDRINNPYRKVKNLIIEFEDEIIPHNLLIKPESNLSGMIIEFIE